MTSAHLRSPSHDECLLDSRSMYRSSVQSARTDFGESSNSLRKHRPMVTWRNARRSNASSVNRGAVIHCALTESR